MRSLLDLLPVMRRLDRHEAIRYHDALSTEVWSYRSLLQHVTGVARHLDASNLRRGDRLLLWGENQPAWVAVFWACVARGIALVPVDSRSSVHLVERIQAQVSAKLLVHGSDADAHPLSVPRLRLEDARQMVAEGDLEPVPVEGRDVVQILYTSGTTGEPKGVVQRHRHVCASLLPIRRELERYRRYLRPFQPIRFLDLLPLGHVYGQLAGLYLPVLAGGSVVFMSELHPAAILGAVRRERVSVLLAVPRLLASLRQELESRFALSNLAPGRPRSRLWGVLARSWRHRRVRRVLGWQFWCLVTGGARLPPAEERFWVLLGLVVVQGYGLTEASSLVTFNHPLDPQPDSLGRVMEGQEVRIAEDGEILVRGRNVSFEYFDRGLAFEPRDRDRDGEDGWLRTGDLGEFDANGVLHYRGRKKDVIVTADGLNVHPIDVESELARHPGVRDAVVMGRPTEAGDSVHAVLLLDRDGIDIGALIRRANLRLEPHQRIKEWSIWPEEDFPRTQSTLKIRRHEVAAWLGACDDASVGADRSMGQSLVRTILGQQFGRRGLSPEASMTLSEDLGLGSLDRIELLTQLESRLGVALAETGFAAISTVGELESWVKEAVSVEGSPGVTRPHRAASPLSGLPRFARSAPFRWLRVAVQECLVLPLFRHFVPLTVVGNLGGAGRPVIFAANHTSHLDTIAILAALPAAWRHRLAPAARQDYYAAYLDNIGPIPRRVATALRYWLIVSAFDAFPLPRSSAGVREAVRFIRTLVEQGYCPLIFPEGTRTRDGRMQSFMAGVGLLAIRLRVPVIPVHLDGLFEVLSAHDRWPKPGAIRIRFGEPLSFAEDDDYRSATARIEEAVVNLAAAAGSRGTGGR